MSGENKSTAMECIIDYGGCVGGRASGGRGGGGGSCVAAYGGGGRVHGEAVDGVDGVVVRNEQTVLTIATLLIV